MLDYLNLFINGYWEAAENRATMVDLNPCQNNGLTG